MHISKVGLICVFLLPACAGSGFRDDVAKFAVNTDKALAYRQSQIDERVTRSREILLLDRAGLLTAGDCEPDILSLDPATAGAAAKPVPCEIIRADGKPIRTSKDLKSTRNLISAMHAYAKSLARLAKEDDPNKGQYDTALSDLTLSIGGLEAAIRSADRDRENSNQPLGIAASILAEVGGLANNQSRAAALRKIIVAANDPIQQATTFLAEGALFSELSSGAFESLKLDRALNAYNSAISRGRSQREIASLQSKLYAAIARVNAAKSARNPFPAIGKAHDALAKSAGKPNSRDFRAAITELIGAVQSVDEALKPQTAAKGT